MSVLSLLDSDDEVDLRGAVRRLLADRVNRSVGIRMCDGDRAAGPALWGAVAGDLGLAGLLVPAALGGGGGSAREASVVLEELGRACAPVPFLTSSVIATALLSAPGVHKRGTDLLVEAADGRRTLALLSPFSGPPPPTRCPSPRRLTVCSMVRCAPWPAPWRPMTSLSRSSRTPGPWSSSSPPRRWTFNP